MSELKAKYIFILAGLAILTGLFLGLSGWLLAILAGWARPWAYGVGLFALSMAGGWIVLLGRGIRIVEGVLGIDINQDGYIGEPEPANPRIIIMDQTDHGRTSGIILDDLPGGEDKFMRLAANVARGAPFAERFHTGRNGPYTTSQFRDLRDYLLMRGLLDWKSEQDNRAGVVINPAGRALVREYAQLITTPYPILNPGGGDGRVRRLESHVRRTNARNEEVN